MAKSSPAHALLTYSKPSSLSVVLCHDYQQIAYDVLWHVVRDDLPPLENVCREELTAELARNRPKL